MRKTLIILSCLVALLNTACTGDSSRPVATGKAGIRAISTNPSAPPIVFLIEERTLGAIDYARMTDQSVFDDLEYIFNFEANFPDELTRRRIASSQLNVERDFQYTFVVTGDLAAPDVIIWEKPIRDWAGTETVFEAQFAHTAESLGPVDVYFADPAIAPAAGEEIGTLAFGEILPVADYESADYVYTFTTAGNPADVLFKSIAFTPAPLGGFMITMFDATANETGPFAVRVMTNDGTSSALVGENVTSTVRFIHASATVGNTDTYTDELLADQIVANQAFRDITGDIDIAGGLYTFTYTPPGNPGSILVEESAVLSGASHNQMYLIGDVALPSAFIRVPDRRSVETFAKFTFVHTAVNHPFVDVYVVDPGTALEDANPTFFRLSPGVVPTPVNLAARDVEIYLTVSTEKTIIAGPIATTTELGDVLEYISYDNVDPATADIELIPLP